MKPCPHLEHLLAEIGQAEVIVTVVLAQIQCVAETKLGIAVQIDAQTY